MVTVMLLLVLMAMGLTLAAAMGKPSLWAAVFLLCLIELLRVFPLGR